ncbi:MAG: rod shape-determining protein MreD [Planctomycetota bacterium]|nr:rod shape-determining protein MreD [Planctomycetota bacterium]
MRAWSVALLFLGMLLLEGTTVWDQPGGLLRPNLLLLPVIYLALWFPLRKAIFAAVAAGLLKDLYSIDPFGLSAVSFAVVSVVVSGLREAIYREHPLTLLFLAGFVSLIPPGFTLLYLSLYGSTSAALALVGQTLLQALHTALMAPLIILPIRSLGPLWGEPLPYRAFPDRI